MMELADQTLSDIELLVAYMDEERNLEQSLSNPHCSRRGCREHRIFVLRERLIPALRNNIESSVSVNS